jgi:hypothetical protein
MLFDDDEQLEVRHVVSLAHHTVSIYSGGDETPEGELFIKRNALCLSRRTDLGEITPDGKASKPFYLFSEQCSEKEDFYFALLRNQERNSNSKYAPPTPLLYDVKDIITLVQRLHSSEEQLQTRWMNAVIGRVFLALYKTPEVENLLRAKITKKISRVKTPSFLSKISLRNVDMGEAAPVITNPKLKDLTVDGELVVEADVKYSGNFRIEVAATARIDLGTRFKAREVNLLLAVVIKRIEGHAMIRIKPPPSNRFWICFATMPKIDMTIEPIVSSRQITYTIILRQIENRIKEVVAESLVFPNWDDSPFYSTEGHPWRGGIWTNDKSVQHPQDPEEIAAQHGDVDEVDHLENGESIEALPEMEKSYSTPHVNAAPMGTAIHRKGLGLAHSQTTGSSSSIDTSHSLPEKARTFRSGSFATATAPIVSTDVTHAELFTHATPPEQSHAVAAMSALSQSISPVTTPVGSPSRPSRLEKPGSQSSTSSRESNHSEKDHSDELTPQPSTNPNITIESSSGSSFPSSPASTTAPSFKSDNLSIKGFGHDSRKDTNASTSSKSSTSTAESKRLSLAAMASAAETAKKWGWNAINRNRHSDLGQTSEEGSESGPRPLVMGRGQPLPPPGMPLPPPDKKTKTAPIPVPKRKSIPPPNVSPKSKDSRRTSNGSTTQQSVPPPLPKRRQAQDSSDSTDDGLMVVEAPANDSEPTTPNIHEPHYMPPWVDDAEDIDDVQATPKPAEQPATPEAKAPPLPKRRTPHRVLSSSPEEDGDKLPSWMAAQEEEARAKSTFVDDDAGLQ